MSNLQLDPFRGYYFEQLEIGQQLSTPRVTVTEDAIIRFALEWDAQPFHVDREAACDSVFGGLVASGLHTLMLSYKLYYEAGLCRGTAVAGLGFDETRFLKPLSPGDTIGVKVTVADKQPSSKPERGKVALLLETSNQNDEVIFRTTLKAYVSCAHAEQD